MRELIPLICAAVLLGCYSPEDQKSHDRELERITSSYCHRLSHLAGSLYTASSIGIEQSKLEAMVGKNLTGYGAVNSFVSKLISSTYAEVKGKTDRAYDDILLAETKEWESTTFTNCVEDLRVAGDWRDLGKL